MEDLAEYAAITPQGQDTLVVKEYFLIKMLMKCGYTEDDAWDIVSNCEDLEYMLAPGIPTYEEVSTAEAYYEHYAHVSRNELIELCGQVPVLEELEQTCHIPQQDSFFVVPEYFEQLNAVYTEDNLPLLKDYLISYLMINYAARLDQESCELYICQTASITLTKTVSTFWAAMWRV